MSLLRFSALVGLSVALFAACAGGGGTVPSPAATVGGDVDAVIAARDVRFDRAELTLPAGEPTRLVFENLEAIPHNVAILGSDGTTIFEGELFNGPAQRTYELPALDAGTYRFVCTIHLEMAGQLTAE